MSNQLTIALLQLLSRGSDRHANLQKGDDFCRRAAAAGADVALFPEMWSIGYQAFDPAQPSEREAWLALAVGVDDPVVQHFRALARELSMAIGITYLERWPGAPHNTLTLFDRHGNAALTYAKVHLGPWNPPASACSAGNEFPVCSLDTRVGPVRVGSMICFDREFPEAARMLMLNGAELILTPNACDLDDRKSSIGDVRIAQFRARAFENLVVVAMTNYPAPQHDGRSVAFYPDGSLIVQADTAERIVLAEIDLDRVRAYREREASRDAPRSPAKYAALASVDHPRPLTLRR
ncbi:MAG: carbon-nitrogen hydrolase family protein [Deltaproteobacteria bacterium]|nr:carbon-nitrogen hydrolase family protein [Deltaproteobacteria bacterium]MBI3386940.1 carbon-nitrogen hydrolase family protein [Deltaproteobacteria bacterium]